MSRANPPNLPALDWIPQIDWRPILIVLAAVVIVIPRLASPVFVAALVAAMLGDQARIQPEVVSLAILMTLPAFGMRGVALSRYHLSAVWLWAGIHKILSVNWTSSSAGFIASLVHQPHAGPVVAVVLPAIEIGFGAASLVPRAWRYVAWGGFALHLAMTAGLLYGGWNEAVWAWNIALGVAALLLFRDRTPAAARWDWVSGPIGVAVLASPVLFYVGMLDGYFANNLYTNNSPVAAVCNSAYTACNFDPYNTWERLSVPLPAEPRLYKQWFDLRCQSDEVLVITGRATVFTDPPRKTVHRCR
jgi:hypothetical protein